MSEAQADSIQLDPSDENRNYSTPLLEEQEESVVEQFETEDSLQNKSFFSLHNLFRKYDFAKSSRSNDTQSLQRVLSIWQLIAFGISSTVGAGVLVTIGLVASKIAGPGVSLSFIFAGFASFLSALCYSEFATRIPVSGSAYTYAYASFGEVFAWFIGWDLMLEYSVSASAIARGWSSYFVSALSSLGVNVPTWIESYDVNEYISISFVSAGIILVCTAFLLGGMNTSAKFTLIFTIFNLVLLFFFIITGSFYVDTNNWKPFLPYGIQGTWRGVGIVFFSYIGFDSVSTLSAEVKNPAKALPIGIVGTLGFATSLYVVISLVVTGMSPYSEIDAESPLSSAFERLGLTALSVIVALGSLTTMTATMLVSLVGQPRIFYQMSMDGLFPPMFSQINKNGIPGKGTIVTGVGSATLALLFNLDSLSQMISVGTLLAFVLVSGGILILRYQQPTDYEVSRIKKLFKSSVFIVTSYCFLCFFFSFCVVYSAPLSVTIVMGVAMVASLAPLLFLKQVPEPIADPPTFRTPWVPFVPGLGILMNIYFIVELPGSAMIRVVIWAAIGMCIYFAYGYKHSVLNKQVKINQSYSK